MEREIEVLNKILKGEYMAIGVYDTLASNLPASSLREDLSSIQKDHERHAQVLTDYIRQRGGEPIDSAGMAGSMAEMMSRVRTLVKPDEQDIIRQLYDGEDQGLAKAVQYAERELGPEARALLEQIFSDEHDHLKTLERLLHQEAGKE
ncbi:MAG TPA: DUF2383 domain-containing protein [Firmicutes bacterium]|nr:DUF2383 domain-containing protein [Bacillota bacterium]